jgi:hypothetical protein
MLSWSSYHKHASQDCQDALLLSEFNCYAVVRKGGGKEGREAIKEGKKGGRKERCQGRITTPCHHHNVNTTATLSPPPRHHHCHVITTTIGY